MLFVLTLDHIGNAFLYFGLYGHGKLDLKFVHGRAEKSVGSNKICSYPRPKSLRKIIEPRVLKKKVCSFADTFT